MNIFIQGCGDMQKAFNKTVAQAAGETEQVLRDAKAKYERRPDGTFMVTGALYLGNQGLTQLPDLSKVVVLGDFSCASNKLTSLKGAPATVLGYFFCQDNALTSLEHAPRSATGFVCARNCLSTLQGAPEAVTIEFDARENPLTSLDHAPRAFGAFKSDIADFAIPLDLDAWRRKQRDQTEAQKSRALARAVVKHTVLQRKVRVSKPLTFRGVA
jgi:hypothetical protein